MTLETHFELTQSDPDTQTTIIGVSGEIHVSTAPQLSRALNDAIARGRTAVVLDLTDTEFIDSTGLSVLLNALRRITRRNGRLVVACTNPTVMRLFQITRLDSTFDIQPTVDDALARLTA